MSLLGTGLVLGSTIVIMTVLAVIATTDAYADISVTQDDLTAQEQKVLDDIATAKADGTYILPPEAELTADIRVYSEGITVNVTHPVDMEAVHCWVNFALYVPTTHCILPGFPPHPDDQYFDTETEEWRPVEELQVASEAEQKAISDETMTREQKYNQERIDYITTRTNPSELELKERSLREQIGALCSNDTLVSQTYRQFDVETEIYLDHEGNWREQLHVDSNPTANDKRDNRFVLGLEKQVQECIGQPYTKKSVQYDHIVVDGLYSGDPNRPQAPDPISASMVNEGANTSDPINLQDIACASYTTQMTRDLYNCPKDVILYEVTGDTPVMNDHADSDPIKAMNACLESPALCLSDSISYNDRNKHATHYGGNYP